MRKLFLVLALVGFGGGSALACSYDSVAETKTSTPIVTADGKTKTPAQTPMPTKTDG